MPWRVGVPGLPGPTLTPGPVPRSGDRGLAEADAGVVGGTREWVRTWNPLASRSATVRSRSSIFWKTPPERATVPSPLSSRMAWQAATVAPARPLWKRAATSGTGTPASRSSTTARTRSPPASRRGEPSVPGPVSLAG